MHDTSFINFADYVNRCRKLNNGRDSVEQYVSTACFLWLTDKISLDSLFAYLWCARDTFNHKEFELNEKINEKFRKFKDSLL